MGPKMNPKMGPKLAVVWALSGLCLGIVWMADFPVLLILPNKTAMADFWLTRCLGFVWISIYWLTPLSGRCLGFVWMADFWVLIILPTFFAMADSWLTRCLGFVWISIHTKSQP